MLRFSRPRRLPRAWPLFLSIALTLVANLAVASRATAQEPIRNASELVKLDVGVLDRDGHFAGGLERSDFRVWDNGVEKPVQFFSPIDSPERVLILVETGPAVYLIHEQHLQALSALLEGLGPSDEAALVTYDDSPRRVLDFSANKQALLDAISDAQFRIGTGDLNFYDSVSKVLDSLSDSVGKKAIVVLTTGLDSSPPSRWDALENRLRRNLLQSAEAPSRAPPPPCFRSRASPAGAPTSRKRRRTTLPPTPKLRRRCATNTSWASRPITTASTIRSPCRLSAATSHPSPATKLPTFARSVAKVT
jgi:hypothetical protein